MAERDTKTRVQLDVSVNELERMNRLMMQTDSGSRKELFNNALSLLEWAVSEVCKGRDIASVDIGRQEVTRLTMPALQAARHSSGADHFSRSAPPALKVVGNP